MACVVPSYILFCCSPATYWKCKSWCWCCWRFYLCSALGDQFSKVADLTPEVVKGEIELSTKKTGSSIVRSARELNIKVKCLVSGAASNAPKEVILMQCLMHVPWIKIHRFCSWCIQGTTKVSTWWGDRLNRSCKHYLYHLPISSSTISCNLHGKTMKKEIVTFTLSGNNDISFTRYAMKALNK